MADDSGVGGFCGLCCTGVLQQFFNTRTWGHWTCCDSICRCNSCWDAGEFDPNDPPGGMAQKAETGQETKTSDDAAPPAYKAAEPMSAAPASGAVDGAPAAAGTQPQTVIGDSQGSQSASLGATAVAQTGNTA